MLDVVQELRRADVSRLGFRADDAADFGAFVDHLRTQPDRVRRIADLTRLLRDNVGRIADPGAPLASASDPSLSDDGLDSLAALVLASGAAHAEYLRRGVDSDVAWASLADLGQQVHIFRRVFGRFGLGAQGWCAENYTGRLLWLGRLQYTLERDRDGATAGDEFVLGVHIPETGPLTQDLVDESLRQAHAIARAAYADFAPKVVTLHSWLLDPDIRTQLRPESNFVRFAERFDLYGPAAEANRDGLFFGFHIEPDLQGYSLDELPQDTALQRALVTQLRGSGVRSMAGRLRAWPPEHHTDLATTAQGSQL